MDNKFISDKDIDLNENVLIFLNILYTPDWMIWALYFINKMDRILINFEASKLDSINEPGWASKFAIKK